MPIFWQNFNILQEHLTLMPWCCTIQVKIGDSFIDIQSIVASNGKIIFCPLILNLAWHKYNYQWALKDLKLTKADVIERGKRPCFIDAT